MDARRVRFSDLTREATAAISHRPARAALTALGTVLGIAALVSIVGLTATARAQVSKRFDELLATQVLLQDTAPERSDPAFPADVEQRLRRVNGVVAAGALWQAGGDRRLAAGLAALQPASGHEVTAPVMAAAPSVFPVLGARVREGRTFTAFDEQRREHVAVLGTSLARTLGLPPVIDAPAVFIDGRGFTVVGLIDDVARRPEVLLAVLVPESTAVSLWGYPDGGTQAIIETQPGAADVVADQAPVALRPDAPDRVLAIAPASVTRLREAVSKDFTNLLLGLGGICLFVGMVGIANTTLVSVLERTGEIGLRRALGARRWHITSQFLLESGALGAFGGLIGSAVGVVSVVAASVVREWTPVIPPGAVLLAPLLGLVTGLLAGCYPAVKAARLEPVEALRR